jgi:hypothetical protein
MLRNEGPLEAMIPWYKGFKGSVEMTSFVSFKTYGVIGMYQMLFLPPASCITRSPPSSLLLIILIEPTRKDHIFKISELPIRKWTNDYKVRKE